MRTLRGNLQRPSSIPSQSNAPALAAGGLIVAGYGLSMAASLPGHLSYDSVIQLLEGRSGAYSGWHPAVMSWLLGLSDSVTPGAGLFVAATAALLFGSLLSLLWIPRKVSWLAVPAAAALIATPQLLLYQGIVWKDVLFADAAVASFVILAHVGAQWEKQARRRALIIAWIPVLTLAVLARQNGILLLPFAAIALGTIARRNGSSAMKSAALAVGSSAIVTLFALAATTALATRIVAERGATKQVRLLELYDLEGALARDPTLQLPDLRRRNPALLQLMRIEGTKFYTPVRSDKLVHATSLQAALGAAPDVVLHRPWSQLVLHRPLLYLRDRADMFRWVLLTPDLRLCVPYVVGLRGPAEAMGALGLKTRVSARDKLMKEYGSLFVGTPLFSHLAFLLLALAEMAFLLVRRRPAGAAITAMLGGAVAFTASFFFISIACDYRYLYLLDLSALAGLLYIAGGAGTRGDLQPEPERGAAATARRT